MTTSYAEVFFGYKYVKSKILGTTYEIIGHRYSHNMNDRNVLYLTLINPNLPDSPEFDLPANAVEPVK